MVDLLRTLASALENPDSLSDGVEALDKVATVLQKSKEKGVWLSPNPFDFLVEQRGIQPLTSRLPVGFCLGKILPYFPALCNY